MTAAFESNAKLQAFKPLPSSLKRMIWFLQNQQPSLTMGTVRAAMRVANLQLDDLLPWVELSHSAWESYGETCIYDVGTFEIVARAWKPGDFSAIYAEDGIAWENVQCFGALEVCTYGLQNNVLSANSKKQLSSGEILQISGGEILQIGNVGSVPAVSLHVRYCGSDFATAPKTARIFNLLAGEVQKTDDGVQFATSGARSLLSAGNLTGDGETVSRYYQQLRDRLRRILSATDGNGIFIRKKLRSIEARIASLQPGIAA